MAKRGFKKSRGIILAFLLLIFAIGIVRGDIPQTFNIHGRLTNAAESPLSGTYVMNFSIYNNPTAGNTLWSSGNMSVTTDSNGVYNLILQNIALPFSEQYFFATRVEGDEEMLPRINLSSSPYALRANVSDNLNETGNYQIKNLNLTGTLNTSLLYMSGGNVGIGTTAPGTPLDVVSSAAYSESGQDVLRLRAIVSTGAIGSGPVLSFTNAGGTELANIRMFLEGGNNFGIGFGVYNTGMSENVLYIKSTGNVGINSISPNALLEVNGGTNISGPLNISNAKVRIDSSGNINTTGNINTSVIYTSGGNVGIGTTSPASLFETNRVAGKNEVNLSGVVYVNSTSGSVGIRTTGPGYPLEINPANVAGASVGTGLLGLVGQHNTVNRPYLYLKNKDAGSVTTGGIRWLDGDGTTSWAIESNGLIETDNLEFNLAGANKMLLTPAGDLNVGSGDLFVNTTSGNVGIGTTAPGAKLEVAGSIWINTGSSVRATGYSGAYINLDTDTSISTYNDLIFRYSSGGSEAMRIKSTGNVGIGTTAPNALLEVNGGVNVSGPLNVSQAKVRIDSNGNINTTGTLNTSVLYMSGGNVGIGTTGPGAKLHILDAAAANDVKTNTLRVAGGADGTLGSLNLNVWTYPSATAGNRYAELQVQDSTDYRNLVLNSYGGNVGIGTTVPASLLETNRVAGKNEVNLSGVMYINSTSGNVGIGTTTPNYILDIDGTARIADAGASTYPVFNMYGYSAGGATGAYPYFDIYRSNSNTKGTVTRTVDGTYLWGGYWRGVDEVGYDYGANIEVIQDGATNTKVPTNMIFSTFSDTAQNVNQLVLHNDGNVGINTTNPSAKLQVVGNVIINGSLTYTASDPEAETFYPATRQRVIDLVNEYVPPDKDGGLTLFFNNDTGQLEAYSHVKNKFYKFQLTELNQTGLAEGADKGNAASTNASGIERKSSEAKAFGNSSGQIYWDGSKLVIKVT